jgi:small subunit ribosomal protein S6
MAGPDGPASGVPAFAAFEPFPKGLGGLSAGEEHHAKGKGILMPLYEHVFLSRQDVSAQQVEELAAQFKGIIEQMGGKITKTEQWGVKSLSYRLRKNRKAHFTLLNLDAPSAALNEIERQERLSEDVLRYLTVRVGEHEEGPSAMMRKSDRDRDDRGGGGFRDRDRGGFRGDRDRGGGGGGFRDRDRGGDRESRPPRDEAPAAATEE